VRAEARECLPFLRTIRNGRTGRQCPVAVKRGALCRRLDAPKGRCLWSAPSWGSHPGARSSAEEHCLHTAGVAGSNPAAPTMVPATRLRGCTPEVWAFSHTRRSCKQGVERPIGACQGQVVPITRSLNVFSEMGEAFLRDRRVQRAVNGRSSAPRRKGGERKVLSRDACAGRMRSSSAALSHGRSVISAAGGRRLGPGSVGLKPAQGCSCALHEAP
jgi:hypothetical protein